MNKKIILILVLLVIAYSLMIIQAPIRGKVINALTGEPLKEIEVVEQAYTGYYVPNPGGSYPNTKWYSVTKTNDKGEYKFPLRIRFTVPLIEYFSSISYYIPICEITDFWRIDEPFCIGVLGIEELWGKPRFNYNLEGFTTTNYIEEKDKIVRVMFGGSEKDHEIIGENVIYKRKESRISLLPKTKNIYLMPIVKDLSECDKASKKELIEECKSKNAEIVATLQKNAKLCEYIIGDKEIEKIFPHDKVVCMHMVALRNKDMNSCIEIKKLAEREGIKFEGSDIEFESFLPCMRSIATGQNDKVLCESLKYSRWVSKGEKIFSSGTWMVADKDFCDYYRPPGE